MAGMNDFDFFIESPTNLSKHLLHIVKQMQKGYDSILGKKGWLNNIKSGVKIRLWYEDKYREIYGFTKGYKVKSSEIISLFDEFRDIADRIALNNLLLMYAHLTEKPACSAIMTKEDEKLAYMRDFYKKKISLSEFNKKFGHYGLNPFELASRRFSEYYAEELRDLAKHLVDLKLNKKTSLKRCISKPGDGLFPVYSALREELKYVALLVISDLRSKLLKFQKRKNIKDVFALKYAELKGVLDEDQR